MKSNAILLKKDYWGGWVGNGLVSLDWELLKQAGEIKRLPKKGTVFSLVSTGHSYKRIA